MNNKTQGQAAEAKPQENLHKNHRKRLMERYQREGFSSFAPHNILELLLFFSIRRTDTNPVAHRLINRFGSLLRVFTAPKEELLEVDGVGPTSAALIEASFAAAKEARIRAIAERPIETYEQLHMLVTEWYLGKPLETVAILLLSDTRAYMDIVTISAENISVPISYHDEICAAVRKAGASQIVLMHNHTNGIMSPSGEDLYLTSKLYHSLQEEGITLLEHLIVWEFDALPILDLAIGEKASGYSKIDVRYIDNYV